MTVRPLLGPGLSRAEFIALVAALMALNALAIDVMLPALPYMGEALGIANENERQFVVGAYMIGFGTAQLVFGPLTDRFGRRAPLLVGLGIYLACAFAATFAPTFRHPARRCASSRGWAPPAPASSPPPSCATGIRAARWPRSCR